MTSGNIARSVSQSHLCPCGLMSEPLLTSSKLSSWLVCIRFPLRIDGYGTVTVNKVQEKPYTSARVKFLSICLHLARILTYRRYGISNPEHRSVTGLPIVLPAV